METQTTGNVLSCYLTFLKKGLDRKCELATYFEGSSLLSSDQHFTLKILSVRCYLSEKYHRNIVDCLGSSLENLLKHPKHLVLTHQKGHLGGLIFFSILKNVGNDIFLYLLACFMGEWILIVASGTE